MNTLEYFDGTEGEWISAAEAQKKQQRYLEKQEKNSQGEVIRAQFFGKDFLNKLMKKNGAVGIRFFFGEDEDGQPCLILVAADKNKKNLVMDTSALKDMPDETGNYGSNGPICPQHCG